MEFSFIKDSAMETKVLAFEELVKQAVSQFRVHFGEDPDMASCAPGRVNLIGEHVDYCDGLVLPMALPMVTLIVGKKNKTSECEILTCCSGVDDPKHIKFPMNNLKPGLPKWANYVKGVIHNYGIEDIPGFNCVIATNVPIGGGLSSSAALEVSTLKFLELVTGKGHAELTDKALICQKAEHDFAGMPCGIMDQLISVMGKDKHALLIDCQTLATQHIPFETKDLAVLICNSNVKHELSSSEYPTRRKQCSQALELMGLKSYKDANLQHLEALKNADEILIKRGRHVITEIKRTRDAADALQNHDFEKLGKLMYESHLSLRNDFEVSCAELDILVNATKTCDGVLGSRMTGGGFGGCTVTLVEKRKIESTIMQMNAEYRARTGGSASFYVCEPSEGARLVNLN